MALVPVIQPPVMKLLTTRQERIIRMKPPREVTQREKIIFPIAAFLICAMVAPGAITLIGMLFLGNLLKESGVTDRLADTARHSPDRHCHHSARVFRGLFYPSSDLLDQGVIIDFRPGGSVVRHRHRQRYTLCKIYEPVFERQNKSPPWRGWRFGSSGFRTCRPNGRPPGRSPQLPADACHGSKRIRRDWIGRGRRYSLVGAGELRKGTAS